MKKRISLGKCALYPYKEQCCEVIVDICVLPIKKYDIEVKEFVEDCNHITFACNIKGKGTDRYVKTGFLTQLYPILMASNVEDKQMLAKLISLNTKCDSMDVDKLSKEDHDILNEMFGFEIAEKKPEDLVV